LLARPFRAASDEHRLSHKLKRSTVVSHGCWTRRQPEAEGQGRWYRTALCRGIRPPWAQVCKPSASQDQSTHLDKGKI